MTTETKDELLAASKSGLEIIKQLIINYRGVCFCGEIAVADQMSAAIAKTELEQLKTGRKTI